MLALETEFPWVLNPGVLSAAFASVFTSKVPLACLTGAGVLLDMAGVR